MVTGKGLRSKFPVLFTDRGFFSKMPTLWEPSEDRG